ncbi:AAA ATPase, partial [Ramicandelaber brevisporus]
ALQRLGVSRPSTGALLWGKPGTGKTLIASACATESSSNFIPVSIPELVHGAIGESEKAIARLFESARRLAPCIVFLDEIDAVFGSRDGKDGSNSGSYGSKIVSQLMRELDVIADYNQRCVIVIGATNLPDTIDSAVTRPGRLDCIIHVPPPTRDDRLDILKVVCSSITLDPSTDLEAVADAAEELTGSDLKAIASIA